MTLLDIWTRSPVGVVSFILGCLIFLIGIVWFVVGMIIDHKNEDLKQTIIGVVIVNIGNLFVQIGNILVH